MNRRSFLALISAAVPAAYALVKLKAQTVVEISNPVRAPAKQKLFCCSNPTSPNESSLTRAYIQPLTPHDFEQMANAEYQPYPMERAFNKSGIRKMLEKCGEIAGPADPDLDRIFTELYRKQ